MFLKCFVFPKDLAVKDLQGCDLKIQCTKVPLWPVLGLKERLAKALGPQITGSLECNYE
ncbi:hypothetical protein F5883DRAFT_435826 [Diaporthe sp. PMI_573]|nr:hypothetical protein F5883DRAFT_435826 [Diaporthaceae sp. PMI_573]